MNDFFKKGRKGKKKECETGRKEGRTNRRHLNPNKYVSTLKRTRFVGTGNQWMGLVPRQ